MLPLLLGAILVAGADPDPPAGPAPSLVVGQVDAKGNLVVHVTYEVIVPVLTKVEVIVDGKKEIRDVPVARKEVRQTTQTHDLSRAIVTNARGKKIAADELAKLLSRPRPVVLATTGRAVDPGYLGLLKDDTIVIVVPAPAGIPVPKERPAATGETRRGGPEARLRRL
jgi:hypothetical protein